MQVVIILKRTRGHQAAGELVGSAAARRRRAAAARGPSGTAAASVTCWPSRRSFSGGSAPFWALFPVGAHRQGRLLGHAEPQHPRLHPLRPGASAPRCSGQALGLPTTMAAFAFIGVAVTSATIVIFGEADLGPGRADRPVRQGRR